MFLKLKMATFLPGGFFCMETYGHNVSSVSSKGVSPPASQQIADVQVILPATTADFQQAPVTTTCRQPGQKWHVYIGERGMIFGDNFNVVTVSAATLKLFAKFPI